MPADSGSSQTPAIRTFQVDSSSLGDLESSVNLFRGDINLSQTLFTMPGRTSEQGLAVSVSLLYQSNVYREATTWNRDAPTSIAGLGWTLPTSYIALDDGGSPTPGLWRYSYWSNGSQNNLVPEPDTPHLFGMPAALAASLADGEALTAAMRSEFGARGIVLGARARVQAIASTDRWTVFDDARQQLFTLAPGVGRLDVFAGGQSFQLFNYQFWRILYYPTYERWVVTTESGQYMSFGGLTSPSAAGDAGADRNGIEWAVRWTDSDGSPFWTGPSTDADRQHQYARAWRLVRSSNIWGDSTNYAYNEFPVDPRTGLIPRIEQRVGAGGKVYTKACYLTSITDVFGRKALFRYEDKLWSAAAPADPREYDDPHKAVPDDTPNAYQDRYETKYLAGISVVDTDAAPLFSIALVYAPRPAIDGLARAVANVTDNSGTLRGDTFKRYLTAVILQNAQGAALPGLEFGYYLDPTVDGASPGALASITRPQGGVASYTYHWQRLPICNRLQIVTPPLLPQKEEAGGVPRVWFGPDYAVTTWYEAAKGRLVLQIFTWLGRWEAWQLDPDNPLLYENKDKGLDLSTLDVVSGQDFVALHFRSVDRTDLYLLRKNTAQPGQWVPATLDGTVTGCNSPTLTYPGGPVSFSAGSNFLIVAQMQPTIGSYAYDRITWRWTTRSWTKDSFRPVEYTYLTASGEYYVTLGADTLNLGVTYFDPTLVWQAGTPGKLPGNPINDFRSIVLAPGVSMLAVSRLIVANSQTINYTVSLFQWDGAYAVQPPTSFSFQDRQEPSGRFATSWMPTIVNNELVGIAGHVLRFTGQRWLENSSLSIANPPSGADQRYAYGPDYALQIVVDGNGVAAPAARVLGFDPNTDSATWTTPAVTPQQRLPVSTSNTKTSNWPSTGEEDYFTLGQYLYFRGNATNWQIVVAASPDADLQALVNVALGGVDRYVLNAQSVVDESPSFLTYYVYDKNLNSADQTAVVLLRNGQVFGAPTTLSGQHLVVAADPSGIGPGRYPGGPGGFFTYPQAAGSFDAAKQYSIYRYTGDAITGPLVHYAVVGLALDDGFQSPYHTSYRPDPASAACDPTGLVVKYYKSTVFPGSDAGRPQFGSVVNTYLNGLEVVTDDNFYDMLDGLLLTVQTLDSGGVELVRTTNDWKVYIQRATAPDAQDAEIVNLFGGFVCQTAQTQILDGVSSRQTSAYCPAGLAAPYSGLTVLDVSATLGGQGTTETFSTLTRYGYDIDNAFRVLHLLTTEVETITTWTPAQGASITTQASATTYTPWPSGAGPGVIVPGAEADFSWFGGVAAAFPFASYKPGQVPTGWVTAGRVLGRTPQGLVYEAVDGCGVMQSTLYGSGTLPVAQFVNASVDRGECTYCGFEAYENAPGVTTNGGVPTIGDAHTGAASLALPAGTGASLTITRMPGDVDEPEIYLLGYWYKTPAGFRPVAGAGWTIAVTSGGQSAGSQQIVFEDTGGVWAYRTVGVRLPAGGRAMVLTATAANTAADTILLDDVVVMPLAGSLLAKTFDTGYNLTNSTMDAGGRTLRTQYDAFKRVVASIGPDEAPKELAQRFLSRQGNTSDVFDRASPNADLTLHPAGGGSFETFLAGEEWTRRWTASNLATDWRTEPRRLSHITAVSDTLSWRGWPGAVPMTAALFFEVTPQAPLTGPVGVTFAEGYRIAYAPGLGYSFTAPDGSTEQRPLGTPPGMAGQWLLVLGSGTVLFFGDGQLLFSASLTYESSGAVTISTGPNRLQFSNLALLAEPRLGISYSDAAGRQRQVQQLHGDPAAGTSDARIAEIIYDALDREVAVTKAAPASFGVDAALPLLRYHPNFANVADFLRDMANSWVLKGDVADYYRGQTEGPVTRSDDDGYPYRGVRFVAAPLSRELERGLPGKPLAIHDVRETSPAERQTVQFVYSANVGTDPSLPSDSYNERIVIGPLKSRGTALQDTAGRQVFYGIAGRDGSSPSQTAASITYADASATVSGGTMAMKLPNYFTKAPQSGQSKYISYILQDPLGLIGSRTDPSCNTTLYIYDPVGRRPVPPPAPDTGQVGYIYYKYDPIGRLVEEGTVPAAWDAEALQARAAERDWPASGVTHSAARLYRYDGDGNDPTKIGQRILVTTANPTPAANPAAQPAAVTEHFGYDSAGHITTVTMKLDGSATAVGTIRYAYNNLNEVIALTYPEGSPLGQVLYRYDDQGRVVAIGSSAATPSDIAVYGYTADGEVQLERRNNEKLIGAYQYTSPGWLQLQSETIAGSSTACFSIANNYQADATLQHREMQFAFGATPETTSVSYTYDGQRRFVSAVVAGGKPGNETVQLYDANGNIWRATQDGADYTFTCASGSDCLVTAEFAGIEASFRYSPDGWLTQGYQRAVEHDLCLGLATNIDVTGSVPNQVRFGYGGQSQRVLKQVTGSTPTTCISFFGIGQTPVASLQDGTWQASVIGPTGLVAVVTTRGNRYFPLRDFQQTVWGLVDEQNLLAAQYNYFAFGGPLGASGPAASLLGYRFMGQLFDPETGLYNFKARLYDPLLRRFYSPDSAHQFASPYIFAGNDPLSAVDPSGNISVWAQVGIGLAMVALAVAGIAISVVTGGAASPAVAAAQTASRVARTAGKAAAAATTGSEAAAAGAATGAAEGAAAAAGEAGAVQAAKAAGKIAAGAAVEAEGAGAAAGAAGAGASSATTASSTLASNLSYLGIQGASGALTGAGTAGLQYDIQHGRDFTAAGFFQAVGIGAAGGFVGGVLGGLPGMPAAESGLKAAGAAVRIGTTVLTKGVANGVSSGVSQLLTNAADHQPWSQGLAKSFGVGFVQGAATEAASTRATPVNELPRVGSIVDRATAAAKSQEAIGIYMSTAFFLVSSYVASGADDDA
jgi:large repetitive protein